jgi:uncharacterized protein (TIRG00374 family)
LPEGIPIALAGGGLVLALLVAIAVRPIGERAIGLLGRLPLLRRIAPRLGEAYEALRTLCRPGPLAWTTLLSTVSWFLECLCLLVIAHGLPGVRLGLLDATFAYAAPTVLGAVALLPGGLGVTEVGMTGILQGLGLDPAAASAVTILVRLATLWWAVFLGILALARFRATRRLARSERGG